VQRGEEGPGPHPHLALRVVLETLLDRLPGLRLDPLHYALALRDERATGVAHAAESTEIPLWAEATCDAAVATLAGWTLASHLCVQLALGLVELVWLGLPLAALGAGLVLRGKKAAGTEPRQRAKAAVGVEILLALACVLGALLPLLFQCPNVDDTYYLNVAAHAAGHPHAALLCCDTLHGIADLPLMLPVYRFQSFELLAAAVAYLTPFSAIQAAHWVLPACFGALLPLATARLAGVLARPQWPLVTALTLAGWLAFGETAYSHGSQAFVRLQQGKGVLVSAWLPLLLAYATAFARAGGRRAGWLLFATGVGAVGLNAMALWAVPLFAGLTLLAAADWNRSGLMRVSIGLCAVLYPVALALSVHSETANVLAGFRAAGWLPAEGETGLTRLVAAWRRVFGVGAFSWAALGACSAVILLARDRAARLYWLRFLAGFVLLAFNPWTAAWVAGHVTGELTFFRLLWFLPIPFWFALVLAAPVRLAPAEWKRWGRVVVVGLAAWVFLALPQSSSLSRERGVRFEPFGLKVPLEAYATAQRAAEVLPSGTLVLAPPKVSNWLGTFADGPVALIPRAIYLEYLRPYLTPRDIARRRRIARIFKQRRPLNLRRLGADLASYDVRGLILPREGRLARLDARVWGFERVSLTAGHSIWWRRAPSK
jgi:hypothetical protein